LRAGKAGHIYQNLASKSWLKIAVITSRLEQFVERLAGFKKTFLSFRNSFTR